MQNKKYYEWAQLTGAAQSDLLPDQNTEYSAKKSLLQMCILHKLKVRAEMKITQQALFSGVLPVI